MDDWNDRDDAVDYTQPDTWPETSFMARERELADLLDDDTMDALGAAYEAAEDFSQVSYTVYMMLLGSERVLLAATHSTADESLSRGDHILSLRDYLESDANQNSGDYFEIRLRQRLEEGG